MQPPKNGRGHELVEEVRGSQHFTRKSTKFTKASMPGRVRENNKVDLAKA
jgi:hypothetical protein